MESDMMRKYIQTVTIHRHQNHKDTHARVRYKLKSVINCFRFIFLSFVNDKDWIKLTGKNSHGIKVSQ